MANRIPIVVDGALFRFEELQNGDDLYLANNALTGVTSVVADDIFGNQLAISEDARITGVATIGIVSTAQLESTDIFSYNATVENFNSNHSAITDIVGVALTYTNINGTDANFTNVSAGVATVGFLTSNIIYTNELYAGLVTFTGSTNFSEVFAGILTAINANITDINVTGIATFVDINCRNIQSSGIITAQSAVFAGNVTIGGTLTYEDVTNIDSIGLVTARSGVYVGAIGSPQIQLNPNGTAIFNSNISGTTLNLSGIVTSPSANITSIQTQNINATGVVTSPSGNITSIQTQTINATGTVTALEFNTPSDITLKQDINPIENALSIIRELKPVSWKWKHADENGYGLIAQDVQEILPDLIGKKDHISLINYTSLIGYLIRAIQELDSKLAK